MKRRICFLLVLMALLSCFSVNAFAVESVFEHSKTVNEGQRVENVFLYGEDGIISGFVTDDVVVINGNLNLTSTARVNGAVFLLGGELTQEPGAQVRKGFFHINLTNKNLNSLLLGVGAFGLIELAKMFLALLILLISLASLFVFKNRVKKAKLMLQSNTQKVGLMGLFATIGLGLIFAALTVTIWGIPVAVLLGLILLILLSVGLGALSSIIGELLLKSFDWGQKPYYQVLIGSLFLVAFLNFPALGILWGILVFIFATGALAASLLPGKVNSDA
ncbi:MAG: hypothetical protein A4E52_01546 [Pelotomaculum sp. PtaB.Bin013]|uniref:Uncharacterized protein n=1 Tax=Pelotomaculum isophthalicicum JI TaxID=947010 RepID=A0A9X4JVS7_9FIRM|nr:hypothetical protein [Pelotomaculum isophthalicicum]MDF9408891.1 hypothetical protein [Pelotomaculum isophthalicicum JI]OPX86069.1 MAG: hypothetical protein A4E52_01546 [Pelotomaculum sp. PtaB.Bin013]